MKPMHLNTSVFLRAFFGMVLVFMMASANSASIQSAKVDLYASRIALMPFITGKLESPDAPSSKPLSRPLDQIVFDETGPHGGADAIMNRLVSQALKRRYPENTIPFDRVAAAYREILDNPMLDTTRKQAVRFACQTISEVGRIGFICIFPITATPNRLNASLNNARSGCERPVPTRA